MTVQVQVQGVGEIAVQGLRGSNVDPGGFEQLTCQPRSIIGLKTGQRIRVLSDGGLVWLGTIEEVGAQTHFGKPIYGLSAVGDSVDLKGTSYAQIYVDRDLSQFAPQASKQRHDLVLAATFDDTPTQVVVMRDDSGVPGLLVQRNGAFVAGQLPHPQPTYDAGPLCAIAKMMFTGIALGWDAFTQANLFVLPAGWSDDIASNEIDAGNQKAAGNTPFTWTMSGPRRFAVLKWFNNGAGGTADYPYYVFFRQPALVGTHGLTLRGTSEANYGVYPSDVVWDALGYMKGQIARGQIADTEAYVIQHLSERSPKSVYDWIADAAKFVGASWGVWGEALSDYAPRLDFAPGPITPTCSVRAARCEDLDPPKARYSQLYSSARVRYQDTAGSVGFVTVLRPNPLLPPDRDRTLELDSGLANAGAAKVYGDFMLALAERSARGGGSAKLPATVDLPGGGARRSELLRAGVDRILVPEIGESFHVRRVDFEQRATDGKLTTSVQLDGGADLAEVLTARKAVTDILTGG